ncbi:MAG: family 1 glycosylhydrolase, partial [Brevundimonas sp.]
VTAPLELWGGHECTVSRTGDVWRDQTRLSGHEERLDDLDRFAGLGLKALRYPVLWERTELEPGLRDWSWPDARLERMRALGLQPIVGLIHHGSGPAWTDLLDPDFATDLAAYAGAAARRYSWVRDWTPVNEPLTTARFSCLYGHWHPHARDEGDFWRALLNQIDAVRLSMRAIRAVRPDARLIQTEDFGHTWGVGACAEQAEHENQRRLMTWDLLAGRVTPDHPLHARVADFGLAERLADIAAAPCSADVIGLNHYATSDRFLDPRLELYPPHTHGGNGQIAYADVEAVRVVDGVERGWLQHLRTLWRRYGTRIAITECHLGCTADQQIRWLADTWAAARAARDEGVEVEALTVWSLLGAFDWNSLLTRAEGFYEPGAFDVSSGEPRLTALGRAVRALAVDADLSREPVAEVGWWMEPQRLLYPVWPTRREAAA